MLAALAQDCQNNQCGPTPSPLTPAHTHLSKSSEAIADEVDAPTGSDSGSLVKDTNDSVPKATVKNLERGGGPRRLRRAREVLHRE